MIATLFASLAAFIATNTDDLFINMLLFSAAADKKQNFAIVQGKFLGTALLLIISGSAAFGLQSLAGNRLWLLGFVPMAIGIKELIACIKGNNDREETIASTGAVNTAFITLASGADNIGVYIPLLADFNLWQMGLAALVFFAMTGLFCIFGKKLADMPALKSFMEKYRPVITPVIYIALGLYIIFC
ncbi:MAG: hypothetical protein E7492_04830 [Ruminococcaceae bacterium]|nr:hypothetical protein [Oscillospiraceae bacterium]